MTDHDHSVIEKKFSKRDMEPILSAKVDSDEKALMISVEVPDEHGTGGDSRHIHFDWISDDMVPNQSGCSRCGDDVWSKGEVGALITGETDDEVFCSVDCWLL